jgi:hypothetical protein
MNKEKNMNMENGPVRLDKADPSPELQNLLRNVMLPHKHDKKKYRTWPERWAK